MSFLAAMLLLNMDLVDAFVAFANLLNRPCQMAFFMVNQPMVKLVFHLFLFFHSKQWYVLLKRPECVLNFILTHILDLEKVNGTSISDSKIDTTSKFPSSFLIFP